MFFGESAMGYVIKIAVVGVEICSCCPLITLKYGNSTQNVSCYRLTVTATREDTRLESYHLSLSKISQEITTPWYHKYNYDEIWLYSDEFNQHLYVQKDTNRPILISPNRFQQMQKVHIFRLKKKIFLVYYLCICEEINMVSCWIMRSKSWGKVNSHYLISVSEVADNYCVCSHL